ncbi:hypothetical protein AVEN_93850-1 [Araneus ventricosus]|uniref:Uncharacterized protein n=1 Tax=Araneus ventricosus TaxID=182803 RepID=A0A4Y2AY57_ARAVE|nr:hypothetical protein AVEN_93850-1 [Araneus ventricosus]
MDKSEQFDRKSTRRQILSKFSYRSKLQLFTGKVYNFHFQLAVTKSESDHPSRLTHQVSKRGVSNSALPLSRNWEKWEQGESGVDASTVLKTCNLAPYQESPRPEYWCRNRGTSLFTTEGPPNANQ